MNKRKLVFAVLIILTIIISLFGYMNFRVKELQGKQQRETDTDTLSEYSNIWREDEGEERIDERAMPKMVDIIINDQKTTILCEDGSVWSCLVSDEVNDAIKPVYGSRRRGKILLPKFRRKSPDRRKRTLKSHFDIMGLYVGEKENEKRNQSFDQDWYIFIVM